MEKLAQGNKKEETKKKKKKKDVKVTCIPRGKVGAANMELPPPNLKTHTPRVATI
jgi:hypothetical protein